MFSSRGLVTVCCLALILAGTGGCGEAGPKKYPVKGTVTLDKKPLANGTVYFKTIETGAIETFEILNGEFQGQALEGERRVEIVSYISKGEKDFDGMKSEVTVNVVPPKYNTDSRLTASVTATGPNEYAFELAPR